MPKAILLLLLALPAEAGHDPDTDVRASLGFQALLAEADRPYVVFLSGWNLKQDRMMSHRRYTGFWVNQMSFERSLRVPEAVPATGGSLLWLDIRWYGWNCRAWQAVAQRDPFTREPWVTHRAAEALRQGAGYKDVRPVKGDDGRESTPVVVMVNLEWFLRETLESDRSTSYYDLLFARFRFPEEVVEWYTQDRTISHQGGDYAYPDDSGRVSRNVAPGSYTVVLKFKRKGKAGAIVDFPKDVADWEKAFGIDKLRAFAKETTIDLDYGAIVAGGRNDPDRGSIVALNDRLIIVYDGPLGRHFRTLDAFKTTGDRDYSEKLIFKDGKFRKGDGADAVFDVTEILSDLPNGGQAGFLGDGQGKRQEVAGNRAADGRRADKHLSIGVRNYMDCLVCHAGSNGFILPRDVEKEDQRAGIKRKFKDKEQEARYRGFFEAWEEDMAASRVRYARMVARTTAHPERQPYHSDALPWDGSVIADRTARIRDSYDAPVSPERAARMLGVSVELYKHLAHLGGVSPDYRTRNHRLNQQVQGKSIPSPTFEADVFRQAGFLLDAYRDDSDVKRLLKP